jgi:SAM-dependent methyltransferase
MSSTTSTRGSAERWGPLWGSEPRDWAANEDQQRPTYEEAIRQVGIEEGSSVLDIGCGSGVFLRLAADRGAHVSGLDASEALIEVAHERVPEADLRVGEMEALPFADDTFDLVTGFNSFFFAADMTAALREAGRVAKPGAAVVIQVWGRPERNDLEAAKEVMRPFLPAPPPDAPTPPPLWSPGVLEQLATEALTPERAFDTQVGVRVSGRRGAGPRPARSGGPRPARRRTAWRARGGDPRGARAVPHFQRRLRPRERVPLPRRAGLTHRVSLAGMPRGQTPGHGRRRRGRLVARSGRLGATLRARARTTGARARGRSPGGGGA